MGVHRERARWVVGTVPVCRKCGRDAAGRKAQRRSVHLPPAERRGGAGPCTVTETTAVHGTDGSLPSVPGPGVSPDRKTTDPALACLSLWLSLALSPVLSR
ncbi:unnamed protein product [Pleuronectes platessa]|uniref:Uncharacterized protein n=1 Tax=Pleuronectes platessa TaxID=8262 RepID=A0A9N7Z2V7_PLEPL|nr:unnamed protein product [Pleuronectes platessa]